MTRQGRAAAVAVRRARRTGRVRGLVAAVAAAVTLAAGSAACGGSADDGHRASAPGAPPVPADTSAVATEAAPTTATATSTTGATAVSPPPAIASSVPARPAPASTVTAAAAAPAEATIVEVAYRVERHVDDAATAGFEEVVEATLSDPRGWSRAGFRLVRRGDAPFLVVLAEGPEVDRLCLPHDTYGEYSCQRSEVVALNAERWREATPKWTGDLATYRQMLVNHEVGHLLGQPHPRPQCPAPGQLAPLMAQQSTELDGCLPNPWPLDSEVAAAARHDRPLAPL